MKQHNPDATRPSQVAGHRPKLLSLRHVMAMTEMSKSSIYAERAAGRFPTPVRVSARGVRWFESEVVAYINSRPRA